MLSESKNQCIMMRDFYLKCDSPMLKYQQLMPDMTAFIPMALWKDGKVVEFLPEPNIKPHGTIFRPPLRFWQKNANTATNEPEYDNTRAFSIFTFNPPILNTILTRIPGVASAKDSLLSMVVKPHVQEYLGEAGTIQDIYLDSMAKTIEATVILQGDPTPLVAKITSYSITESRDCALFSIQQWSNPWLNTDGQRFSPTAEIPLSAPYFVARNLL